MLKQEHIVWWNSLDDLWKNVFLKSIYNPSSLRDYWDRSLLHTGLREQDDILRIFNLEYIEFINDVCPSPKYAVTFIPSLKFFKNVQKIIIANNYLEDLSSLQEVKTLKSLSLHDNATDDNQQLKYISGLLELEELDLSFNCFTDLAYLNNLPKLRELLLYGVHTRETIEISSLVNFPCLEILHMDVAKDITPLAKVKTLKKLDYGTDEWDYDPSQLLWLIEQLPDCEFEFTLPAQWEDTKDKNFLYGVILSHLHRPNVNTWIGLNDTECSERIAGLADKYRYDKAMSDLILKAKNSLCCVL